MYRFICVINTSTRSFGFACLNCFTRKQTKTITARDTSKGEIIRCVVFDILYWV